MSSILFATLQRPLPYRTPHCHEEVLFSSSAVSSWMLTDIAHFHKDFDPLSQLMSCNVIHFYPFPSKISSSRAETSHTCINTKPESWSPGVAVKLHSFNCSSADTQVQVRFGVWVFQVILSSEFSHAQQLPRTHTSTPEKIA